MTRVAILPSNPSTLLEGTIYYEITSGTEDFSHVIVNLNGTNYTNYSVSAFDYSNLQYNTNNVVSATPYDLAGNRGNTITYSWVTLEQDLSFGMTTNRSGRVQNRDITFSFSVKLSID
jgi:hypothetical protein